MPIFDPIGAISYFAITGGSIIAFLGLCSGVILSFDLASNSFTFLILVFWAFGFIITTYVLPLGVVLSFFFIISHEQISDFNRCLWGWILLLLGAVLFWVIMLFSNYPNISSLFVEGNYDYLLTVWLLLVLITTLYNTIKAEQSHYYDIVASIFAAIAIWAMFIIEVKSILVTSFHIVMPHIVLLVLVCILLRKRKTELYKS